LKEIPESQICDLLEIVEFPRIKDIQKMAVAAATLGTYSRCNPKTIGDILSDKSDTIMALIKAFPFEYEP
jgi:hypothetical protein